MVIVRPPAGAAAVVAGAVVTAAGLPDAPPDAPLPGAGVSVATDTAGADTAGGADEAIASVPGRQAVSAITDAAGMARTASL
jgi:hypothetical protein